MIKPTGQTRSFKLSLENGELLQVTISRQPGSEWGMLAMHGLGSDHSGVKFQTLGAACSERGISFASFDFRGHGKSMGRMLDLSGSRLLADCEAVQTVLAAYGMERYGLVGSSMGGWAAAWEAVRHPQSVLGLVLMAPSLDFPSSHWNTLTPEQQEEWKTTGKHRFVSPWIDIELGYSLPAEREQFPLETLQEQLAVATLIMHGMRDDSVPYTQSIAFAERCKAPQLELRLYGQGDHRLLQIKDEVAEETCRFFQKLAAK